MRARRHGQVRKPWADEPPLAAARSAHGAVDGLEEPGRRRPTVLLAAPYVAPHLGGVENYVHELARMFRDRHGWRVVIATTEASRMSGEARAEVDGILTYRLPSPWRVSNTPIGLGWLRLLRNIIREERVDLVNGHAPVPLFADVAARASSGTPFVLTYHTGPLRARNLAQRLLLKGYERYVLSVTAAGAAEVICNSSYVADANPALSSGRASIVWPGIDPRRFRDRGAPEPGRLLFAASLEKATAYKGLSDLLNALAGLRADHPATRLDVAGDGDARAGYEELAEQLGVAEKVRFLGQLGREELAEAIGRASVAVLPTHYDSFPTFVLEAMASGRPVVSTRVGDIPALVRDGTDGLLVRPGDVGDLGRALRNLLADPERARRMGAAAGRRVRSSFSWARQADRTVEVFERALTSARAGLTVAVVAPYYPPAIGGVEQYAEKIAEKVRDTPGLRCVVVTVRTDRNQAGVTYRNGIKVIRLPAWLKLSNTPVNPLWWFTLRTVLKRERVDVLNVHSPVPFLADVATFAAGKRPVVLTYHAGSMVKGAGAGRWLDALLRWYEAHVLPRTFARAARVVAVSSTSLAHGVPGFVTVSPGVDLARFRPKAKDQTRSSTILYVGRMDSASSWKGVEVLITSFIETRRAVPRARLKLVGSGDSIPGLRALAESLGLEESIEFTGPLAGEQLVSAYQHACALVLPSLTESESFGMTLVEAMACGRPVVGSRVGGIPYVIEDGVNGLLVPPGDPAALSRACQRLLLDSDLNARLGSSGRRAAQDRYSWDERLDQYVSLFRALARPRDLTEAAG